MQYFPNVNLLLINFKNVDKVSCTLRYKSPVSPGFWEALGSCLLRWSKYMKFWRTYVRTLQLSVSIFAYDRLVTDQFAWTKGNKGNAFFFFFSVFILFYWVLNLSSAVDRGAVIEEWPKARGLIKCFKRAKLSFSLWCIYSWGADQGSFNSFSGAWPSQISYENEWRWVYLFYSLGLAFKMYLPIILR